jgi:aryl-alcohol dehydrogenase-like predicted oxidoreductase
VPNVLLPRWVLDQAGVGSVIVGTRLGYVEHLQENKNVLKLELTPNDHNNIIRAARGGKDLHGILGGVGEEYRRRVNPR